MSKTIPAVGSTLRPVGSEILYRVIAAGEHGCRVEAIDETTAPVPGRQPRKLHYSEKRFSLACDRNNGTLFDDRWRAWERA
jgi:hypothetical protein